VVFAASLSYSVLREKVQAFRDTVSSLSEPPFEAFIKLVDVIGVERSTLAYYRKRLSGTRSNHKDTGGAQTDSVLDKDTTPFHKLEKLISKQREMDWGYVPTYIERYEEAGGFQAVSRRKLQALMAAEEDRSERRKGKEAMGLGIDMGQSGGQYGVFFNDGSKRREEGEFTLEVGSRGIVASPGFSEHSGSG
jgi:hypothetical protein